MVKEAQRWLKQADADYAATQHSVQSGDFEWSCFQAQQAAEKSLKAYLYHLGYTSIMSHSLTELIRECTKLEKGFSDFRSQAKSLDMYYIPTRYPNGLAGDLAPTDFYEQEDAQQCLSSAGLILAGAKKFLPS